VHNSIGRLKLSDWHYLPIQLRDRYHTEGKEIFYIRFPSETIYSRSNIFTNKNPCMKTQLSFSLWTHFQQFLLICAKWIRSRNSEMKVIANPWILYYGSIRKLISKKYKLLANALRFDYFLHIIFLYCLNNIFTEI